MPYLAQRTAPDGTIIEEEIPTPEEEAYLASAGGYGPAPIPPPAAAPLVDPGTPPPPTATVSYPTAGVQNDPGGAPEYAAGYGEQIQSDPVPPPTAYNFDAAEPYGMSEYAVQSPRGSDRYELRSQENYSRETPGNNSYGIPDSLATGLMLDDATRTAANEGVSWDAVRDPGSWIPEPNPEGAGGRGEAAFLAGPVVSPRARSTGRRTAPSGATFAERPGRVPPPASPPRRVSGPMRTDMAGSPRTVEQITMPKAPANQPIPDPPPATAPGPRTFPRLAGEPGTPAPGGGVWGPGGRTVLGRPSQLAERPPIELPATSDTIPPPSTARASTRESAQAAGQAGYDAVTGTTLAQRALGPLPNRTGRQAPSANRRSSATTTEQPPNAAGDTTPPPASGAVGAATGRSRNVPTKRIAALLGAGAVGGGVAAAHLTGQEPAPGAEPADRRGVPPPLEPGVYSPSTNPQSPADWQGATTRSLQLMKDYSPQDWGASTRRVAVDINGVPNKLIEAADAPGLYVGYVDESGAIVPVGNDVSPEDFLAMVVANAAEAPAGWGDAPSADAVPDPDADAAMDANAAAIAANNGTGTTLEDASIPAPDSNDSWNRGGSDSWNSGGSSRSSGRRWESWDDSGESDYERDFTADDFLEQADGDRRKAAMMAKAANKKRRKGKRGQQADDEDGGMWPGFPFNRPPSPTRANILASLEEAFAAAFPNRGR